MVSCAQEKLPGSFQLFPAFPRSCSHLGPPQVLKRKSLSIWHRSCSQSLIPLRLLAPRSRFFGLSPLAVTRSDINQLADPRKVPRELPSRLCSRRSLGTSARPQRAQKYRRFLWQAPPPDHPAPSTPISERHSAPNPSLYAHWDKQVLGRGRRLYHVPSDTKGGWLVFFNPIPVRDRNGSRERTTF